MLGADQNENTKTEELLKTLNATGGYAEREKRGNRLMSLVEYSNWKYSDVLEGGPNYVAYICTGGGGKCDARKHFQECQNGRM